MPAFQFNSQGVDPQYGGGGGLPLGRHPVVIAESALKPTKDQQGGFLELRIEAIDGPAKGLSTFDRLNLHNKSAQAVEIANKQLAAYCHVTGVFAFNATEELHGKPFIVEMIARKDNPNQTEIGKIFDINGNEPGKAGSGAPTGGQPTGGGAAWGGGGGAPAGGQPTGGQPADQGGGQPSWAGGGAPGGQGGGAAPSGGGWNQGQGGGQAGPWGQK